MISARIVVLCTGLCMVLMLGPNSPTAGAIVGGGFYLACLATWFIQHRRQSYGMFFVAEIAYLTAFWLCYPPSWRPYLIGVMVATQVLFGICECFYPAEST